MASHDGAFHVLCECGKRRGVYPGQVLVCPRCDYSGEAGPDEDRARDVRSDATHWAPERSENA